jgi:hypothetical protein
MLIATFGPTTQWEGSRITWADDRFVLENHGPIAPVDVMEYDRQGHLLWPDEGTRAWVGSMAAADMPAASGQESTRLSRVLIAVIIALMLLNLVLLVVAGHAVHLF